MLQYYISKNYLTEAQRLLAQHPQLHAPIAEELNTALSKQADDQKEKNRLQAIGKENDPLLSPLSKERLLYAIVISLSVFLYCLLFTPLGDIEQMTPQSLLFTSIFIFSPLLFFMLFFRRVLSVNVPSTKLTIAFATLFGSLIINRSCSYYMDITPLKTVIVDMILVAAAMFNTYPSLKRGPMVGLISLLTVPCLLVYPNSMRICAAVLAISLTVFLVQELSFIRSKKVE